MANLLILTLAAVLGLKDFTSMTYTQPPTTNMTCRPYTCVDLPGDECMRFTYHGVLLDSCGQDQFCPLAHEGTSSCRTKPPELEAKWPGEHCSVDHACLTGACNNRVCEANKASDQCTRHEDCGVGLRCHESKCAYQIYPGRSGCYSDFDCSNNAGCLRGKCVRYFSLAEGDQVEVCENGSSLLCESTLCYQKYCLAIVKNDQPSPTPCESAADCVSTHYVSDRWSLKLYKPCVCSYSGQGYCELFPGDEPLSKYLHQLMEWVDGSNIHNCHSVRRFSEECMQEVTRRYWSRRYMEEYYKVHHFPRIQGISQCAKEAFEPKAVVDGGLALAVLAGLVSWII